MREHKARTVQVGLLWLFMLGVMAQFFLAGAGIWGASSFEAHSIVGHALVVVVLLAVGAALVARTARQATAVLLGLTVLQMMLANLGSDVSPWVAALHPVNAVIILTRGRNLLQALHAGDEAREPSEVLAGSGAG